MSKDVVKIETWTPVVPRGTKFFTFDQNNSGGSLVISESLPIAPIMVFEAVDCEDANRRAGRHGLYFDGVEARRDCACCGDRWYELWGEHGDDVPSHNGVPLDEYFAKLRYWPVEPGQLAAVVVYISEQITLIRRPPVEDNYPEDPWIEFQLDAATKEIER